MTHRPQPPERFAQHPRLAELVTALGFRRYPLVLTGLLYQEPGGPQRRATAVASRDGDLRRRRGGRARRAPPDLAAVRRRPHRVVPLEVTDALLEEFRRLADRHQHGVLVDQVMELPTTS
jgi:hypothetical protein